MFTLTAFGRRNENTADVKRAVSKIHVSPSHLPHSSGAPGAPSAHGDEDGATIPGGLLGARALLGRPQLKV